MEGVSSNMAAERMCTYILDNSEHTQHRKERRLPEGQEDWSRVSIASCCQ